MAASGDSNRAILFALGANFAIACAKGTAAFFTGSSAMLAETVHSLADCGNQLLLMLGMRRSEQPPSPEYPLGHGKEIYFWSFLVAVMLFTVGGMFSIYEGVHKLADPQPLKHWKWAAGVLAFGVVAEGYSLRACLQEVDKMRRGRGLWRWFRESRQSELLVILGEDIAAIVGLALALGAVVLATLTGNPAWDAFGSLAIGALLVVVAVLVAVEVKAMLIGQSVDPALQSAIRGFLEQQPEIAGIVSLITLQLGDDMMVSVQANMHERASGSELVAAINRIEREMRALFPDIRWSFFEPETSRGDPHDQDYALPPA